MRPTDMEITTESSPVANSLTQQGADSLTLQGGDELAALRAAALKAAEAPLSLIVAADVESMIMGGLRELRASVEATPKPALSAVTAMAEGQSKAATNSDGRSAKACDDATNSGKTGSRAKPGEQKNTNLMKASDLATSGRVADGETATAVTKSGRPESNSRGTETNSRGTENIFVTNISDVTNASDQVSRVRTKRTDAMTVSVTNAGDEGVASSVTSVPAASTMRSAAAAVNQTLPSTPIPARMAAARTKALPGKLVMTPPTPIPKEDEFPAMPNPSQSFLANKRGIELYRKDYKTLMTALENKRKIAADVLREISVGAALARELRKVR